MANLSKLEYADRYHDWYHGYSKIELPSTDNYGVIYNLDTTATGGTVSTQYFGEKFDANKVDAKINVFLTVYVPDNARINPNLTLNFEIEKISMKYFSTGYDRLFVSDKGNLDVDLTHMITNYTNTALGSSHTALSHLEFIKLERNVPISDVRKQKLRMMPGFKFKWYYSGMEVQSLSNYNKIDTKAFVRYKMNF